MCPHAQIQEEPFASRKIRCALVHDHVLLRQGLRRLLEDEPDMEVVAEAGNAAEALLAVMEHGPEVVIAGAHVFQCGADEAERLIVRESPRSRVLFLSMHEGDRLREGIAQDNSCAVRETSAEQGVEMVRGASAAEKEEARALRRGGQGEWPAEEQLPRKRVLTVREREVLKLLAEGQTVRSAAGVLGLSVKTVDAHKFNLMRKLGIHNKAELVMWAIQKRVVKLPANF